MTLRSIHTAKFILVVLAALLVRCTKITSEDPEKCYTLWSGKDPGNDVKIIHGKYWQYGDLVKEYTLFMELQPSSHWRNKFMKENKLVLSHDDDDRTLPADVPAWFAPSKRYKVWTLPQPYSESRYFEDSVTNHMFIYEIEI